MKKLMLTFLLIITWVALCAGQTPSPILWSRNIVITGLDGDMVFRVTGATVTAAGVTTATAVTDSKGECYIEVLAHETGTVTSTVTIIDALMIAQYVVGMSVASFNAAAADVTNDGVINIADALRIAQYFVGLISSL